MILRIDLEAPHCALVEKRAGEFDMTEARKMMVMAAAAPAAIEGKHP